MKPRALILYANGSNRDQDVAYALELAGAQADIVPLRLLQDGSKKLADYQMLVVPGGFSYADTLGAGRLLALDLKIFFAEAVQQFVATGKPVIGICNGFQALVKAGLLPALQTKPVEATLTFNQQGQFECRWVTLLPTSKTCIWTKDLADSIDCPVAHGEGNFMLCDERLLPQLQQHDQVAICYGNEQSQLAAGVYPYNPNGSIADIAGVCNPQGNVLGLMPHPENHVLWHQNAQWTRGKRGRLGLPLFVNGVRYAAS